MASSTVCRGGKGSCECEEFYPSEANDRICKECMHGKSNHPRSLPTITGPPTNSLPPQSNPRPSTTASSSAVDVFHNVVGKQGLSLTRETQRSSESEPGVVSLAKARAEVLGTFSSKRQADNPKLVRQPTVGLPHKVTCLYYCPLSKPHPHPCLPQARARTVTTGSTTGRTASGSGAHSNSSISHIQSIGLNIGGIDVSNANERAQVSTNAFHRWRVIFDDQKPHTESRPKPRFKGGRTVVVSFLQRVVSPLILPGCFKMLIGKCTSGSHMFFSTSTRNRRN